LLHPFDFEQWVREAKGEESSAESESSVGSHDSSMQAFIDRMEQARNDIEERRVQRNEEVRARNQPDSGFMTTDQVRDLADASELEENDPLDEDVFEETMFFTQDPTRYPKVGETWTVTDTFAGRRQWGYNDEERWFLEKDRLCPDEIAFVGCSFTVRYADVHRIQFVIKGPTNPLTGL
jgi:hypothetical protein